MNEPYRTLITVNKIFAIVNQFLSMTFKVSGEEYSFFFNSVCGLWSHKENRYKFCDLGILGNLF